MSVQSQLNQEVLDMLPKSFAYANSCQRNRSGHHRNVIIQAALRSNKPLSEMTKSEVAEFDDKNLDYLKSLDNAN